MATKWGIIGTGRISSDFVLALQTLPDSEHVVTAVAASSSEKGSDFAKKFNIPVVCSDYEDMGNQDVDVVYIGTINPLHFSNAKSMLEKGKHVLCEKPLCMNVDETKELVKISREKHLFLMEAIWSRCFPIYRHLREILETKKIGDIQYVQANFGVPIFHKTRIVSKELGGGTILDLGVYVIQFALLALGLNVESVYGFGTINESGVDETATMVLKYPDGKIANLVTHGKVKLDCNAKIFGSEGFVEILDPFWCPTDMRLSKFVSPTVTYKYNESLPPSTVRYNHVNSEGLAFEAQEVRSCLLKGLIESPVMTHEESIVIAEIQAKVMSDLVKQNAAHNSAPDQ